MLFSLYLCCFDYKQRVGVVGHCRGPPLRFESLEVINLPSIS
jgi:hypothetical protein